MAMLTTTTNVMTMAESSTPDDQRLIPGDPLPPLSFPADQPPAVDRAMRLRWLWLAWLLAMLFHVDLGLMPLFHGQSPEIESQVPVAMLPLLFGAMLGYFLVPLACVVTIAYAASDPSHAARWRPWRRLHFWISVVYTVSNLPHLIADILVPDSRADQVALMVVLVLIGLVINGEGWAWWRDAASHAGPAAAQRPAIASPASSKTPSNSTELR
jgi:hypothetical protein